MKLASFDDYRIGVLNDDGVFASRDFPGVGAWMAPFVAWGEPVWGHYLAGVLTAIAVLAIGRELAGNGVGLLWICNNSLQNFHKRTP